MNKYILLLGVAGVALGSYCAYAGNSATMTVTATIAHDVSLTKTRDLSLGTITINPAYTGNDTTWIYNLDVKSELESEGVVSADDPILGTFTANIPNPEACHGYDESCGGLSVTGNAGGYIYNIFGGSDNSNRCLFYIHHTEANNFQIFPSRCDINDISKVTPGTHTGTLTISYNAG
ncbi:MAG: hypothetical protein IJ689_01105 [Alphaproteobacteria bacterium]|nr:hypothetical protein [Alphaproteobacteria bacterium]